MPIEKPVLMIDRPKFVVRLDESTLRVDLKEGVAKELEEILEASPILRETIGFVLQNAIPLDVPLKDIASVTADAKGLVKIVVPLRRDVLIPLGKPEADRLVEKLNELIPLEKERYYSQLVGEERAAREVELKRSTTLSPHSP